MKKYILFTVSVALLLPITLSAQKKWTLRDCIDYAREENIQVKKSQLSVNSYEIDVQQSKAALFPNLSGNISQGYSHEKVKNTSNAYHYKDVFSGNYGLNASWTIFNGNKNMNNIKQSKLQKEAEEFNTRTQQNNIEISITEVYLQLLYTRESVKNNENTVATSEAQLKQTKDLLDAGSITRSEYAQVESQLSSDKYNMTLAQNSFDNYKLQLKQLLELGIDDSLDIEFPEIGDENVLTPIPSKRDIYTAALSIMPEIKNSQLSIDIAKLSRSTAKGGYLPTVSLTGNIGTSNIYNESPSFSSQISRNFGQTLGLSISVPIFDNRTNKSNVQKANIEILTAELNYTDAQKTLLKTIEGLYQDAVSGQSNYMAAKAKLNSSKLSYELVKEQYDLGMRNTVELTTEQNTYSNALQELLQAKYTALLSLKLLNFYQGQKITL